MELFFSNNLCAAFLVEIVRSFQKKHGDKYLGRTAVQKLAYFCQSVGVPVPCSFEIYNYGPYSDEVKFCVDSLLADDVLMDASQTQSKYSNYKLTSSDIELSRDLDRQVSKYRPKISEVVNVFGAFEPQQLELIATLHFIAHKQMKINGRIHKNTVIDEFERIKRAKFERSEVITWYDALSKAQLI